MMKLKLKKGERIPRNVIKMFAIASTVGAILKSNNNGDPRLTALAVQINRAMKVFNVKAGRVSYQTISKEVGEIWGEIVDKYTNEIEEEQVPVYIEMLCTLVSDRDFTDFLGVQKYKAEKTLYIDDKVLEGILFLDVAVNKLYGCKPTTYQLRKAIVLKEKPIRNKKVSKRQLEHQREVERHIARKERKNAFMASIRAMKLAQEKLDGKK